jgi:hypothetical protein
MSEGPTFNITNQTAGRDIIQAQYIAARDLRISPDSPPEDLLKVIEGIKFKVKELNLEEKQKTKAENHLNNAEAELKDKNPDKNSIADSIKQTNDILKEAKTTGESLKEIGVLVFKAAVWLGTTAAKLGWIF